MILVIKTDTKEALVELRDDSGSVGMKQWQADRSLANDLPKVIKNLLEEADKKMDNLNGVVVYEGPGSYTGLRIGISVANSVGKSFEIPVVATTGDNWLEGALEKLKTENSFKPVVPNYGGEVFTTKPRK